ncbi:MAG: HlyD family secretion protein [Ktedonobacteraceae bacterium]
MRLSVAETAMTLFRREALEHQKTRKLPEAITISPLSFKLLAAFVAGLLAAIGCLLYWGTYTNKQTVTGYIRPSKGLLTIYAPARGTVVNRYVHLGDHVRDGEKLYKITVERSTSNAVDVNVALIEQYEKELEGIYTRIKVARAALATKVATFKQKQQDVDSQIKQLKEQLRTDKLLLTLAEDNQKRYRSLARKGMISQADLQKVAVVTLSRQSVVEQIELNILQMESQLRQMPAQIAGTKTDTEDAITSLAGQAAQLKLAKLQLQATQDLVIRAPVAGVVSAVMVEVGQRASSGQALLSLLPRGSELEAQLIIPTGAIGFVHVGEPVLLRYSAFPYQQFGLYRANLTSVSRSIITPGELSLPVNINESYYLASATLEKSYVLAYGQRMPLSAGMTLNADIVLNRERLYQWIFSPLKSLGRSM